MILLSFLFLSTVTFSENSGDLGSGLGEGKEHRKLPYGPNTVGFLTGKKYRKEIPYKANIFVSKGFKFLPTQMATDLSDLNPHHVEVELNDIKVTFKVPVAPHVPTVPPMGIGHVSTALLLVWIPLHFGLPNSFSRAPLPSVYLLV